MELDVNIRLYTHRSGSVVYIWILCHMMSCDALLIYRICFNYRGVNLSQIADLSNCHVYVFV